MAGYYPGGSKSSSGGGYYGGGGTSKKADGTTGLLHKVLSGVVHNPVTTFEGNLLKDIGETAIGLPTGLVNLATHPVASTKLMGKGIWADWSPLFEGDPARFAKNFYDHPLGPILDVATVLTAGAGGAAKAAKVLSEAGLAGDSRIVKILAEPELDRPLFAGHPKGSRAVPEHYKTYNQNPIIRARQITTERAVNGLASMLPDWFKVDPKIGDVASSFSGSERADAWRWYRADKYDAASRAHAASAAQTVQIAAIMKAADRMAKDPVGAAHDFIPHIVQNLQTHAYRIHEGAFPDALTREMNKTELSKAERAAAKEHKAAQAAADSMVGVPESTSRALVPYDEATARAGRAADDTVDSYGFEVHDVPNPKAKTIDSRFLFVDKNAEANVMSFLQKNPKLSSQELADYIRGQGRFKGKNSMASHMTTSKWQEAAREGNDFLLARNHSKYFEEAGNSTHFLGAVGRKFTTMWKWMVLAIRPGFFVNNAVGNWMMYATSLGPQGARGFIDAMRQIKRPQELQRDLSRAEARFFRQSYDWQDKYYLGLHQGFGRSTADFLGAEPGTTHIPVAPGWKGKFKKIAGTGLYDLTHELTDRQVRRAAINTILRQNPEVKALMKQGHSFDDAAAAVSENRALRETVQQRVNDVLGQYHYLNPTERAVRAVIPFYTWDRAIVRHGAHLYLDKPFTARVMTELGAQGVQTTEDMLGDVPDFLKGALPLSMVGLPAEVDGRVPILGTSGLNPYSSLNDVIRMGQLVTSGHIPAGEVFAGEANPFYTALMEQVTGTNLLTGKPLPKSATQGSLPENMIASIIEGLPQTKIVESATGHAYQSPDTLYKNDLSQFLLAYIGVPAKQLNTKAAEKLAKERERG